MTDAEPPESVELDALGRALYDDWAEAKAAAEQWKARQDELASLLVERMGGAKAATIDGRHVVSYVAPSVLTRFDERRFHEANPDLWADYVVPQHRAGHLRMAKRPAQ